MQIETMLITKINPSKYNPRKDLKPGDPEYDKLKTSILEFDMVEPLVWNRRTGNLVGGHQRLKILKELEYTEVEVSAVDLSPSKEKALNLALNKIQGEWDIPKLKDVLQDIDTGEFDMDITGFDEEEREDLLGTMLDPWNIDDLLDDVDISQATDRPLWAVIRTTPDKQEILEAALALLETEDIRVERNYAT